jgi:adenine-specific DNA-methyltransferase
MRLVAAPADLTMSAQERRAQGITFTPEWLVEAMLARAAALGPFDTVVDPGAGTGRFAIAAAQRFPRAAVLAIELNPRLAAVLRERVQQAGLQTRVTVIEADFRVAALPLRGRALFIGNPPYVRHHDIGDDWKRWYSSGMAARGVKASQLAGLHAHFLLRSVQAMRPADALCFVTAAEWLDNGYGSALRALLTATFTAAGGCGLRSLWLAAADEPVFPDALVSAVVIEAVAGDGCQDVDQAVKLGRITGQRFVPARCIERVCMHASERWSELCQPGELVAAQGTELGELFRITRGQVTGMNAAWLLPTNATTAMRELAVPAVTRAREIIDGTVCAPNARERLRLVVDLPPALEQLEPALREAANELIDHARRLGADKSYIARQRKPWFAVGMRAPPAAFVSYMGRRPPVFRPNPQQLSFLNIAHGLHPRQPITATDLQRVLNHLNTHTGIYSGRVYGGGLAKFEPSDVARLRLPASVWETKTWRAFGALPRYLYAPARLDNDNAGAVMAFTPLATRA